MIYAVTYVYRNFLEKSRAIYPVTRHSIPEERICKLLTSTAERCILCAVEQCSDRYEMLSTSKRRNLRML
jgi:hypothetical protein